MGLRSLAFVECIWQFTMEQVSIIPVVNDTRLGQFGQNPIVFGWTCACLDHRALALEDASDTPLFLETGLGSVAFARLNEFVGWWTNSQENEPVLGFRTHGDQDPPSGKSKGREERKSMGLCCGQTA
jgi:hypothetical protein